MLLLLRNLNSGPLGLYKNSLMQYPSSMNLSFLYSLGSLIGIVLLLLISQTFQNIIDFYYSCKIDSAASELRNFKPLLSLCVPSSIVVRTKRDSYIRITPINSYYNLHSSETQAQFMKDNSEKAGVYIIVDNITLNFYVGSANTNLMTKRFLTSHLFKKTETNSALASAIRRRGIENFSLHIIEYFTEFINKEDLKSNLSRQQSRELFYISTLEPAYNLLLWFLENYLLGSKSKEKVQKVEKSVGFGKSIILCNSAGDALAEYNSITEVSKIFSCSRQTVSNYLDSGKAFFNAGYLRKAE